MIIRITNKKSGIVEYLKSGIKPNSTISRDEKDLVVPILNDINNLDETIKYINKYKKYSTAYSHITLSFTEKDFEKFCDENDDIDLDKLFEFVKDYLNLFLAGYNEDEYIAYSELHYPKIKVDENGNIRLPHLHLVVPHLNLNDNTKLQTPFFNVYNDNLIQTYLNRKYNLDLPIQNKRENYQAPILSKEGLKRKELQEVLKDIANEDELLEFFNQNNFKYRKVETKKNTYYKIIQEKPLKDINLRGKGLEHLEEIAKYGIIKNLPKRKLSIAEIHSKMTIEELEQEIKTYIDKRVEFIIKRRSVRVTQKLLDKYTEENTEEKTNYIKELIQKNTKLSYQEKILKETYNKVIKLQDRGFYIKKDQDKVIIKNKIKDINIEDKKDKIVAKGKNYQEQVKIMLDLAEAKGWDLSTLVVNGSDEFKKEVYKQIKERLNIKKFSISSNLPLKEERPSNLVDKVRTDLKQKNTLDKELIKEIKNNLNPETLLNYVAEHYNVDLNKYEVFDNKINNKTNKQKPKNVIDFLNKEVGLNIKEAFEVANNLYQEQIKLNKKEENIKDFTMNITYNSYTKIDYPIYGWKQRQINTKTELETVVKNYSYSNIVFGDKDDKQGYRSSDVAIAINSLILDFDNEDKNNLVTMQEIADKLKLKGIKALLVTTKSHNKEKHGIIAERFRVIIPIDKNVDLGQFGKDKREIYKKALETIYKELEVDKFVDKATFDLARQYKPSPMNAKTIVLNGRSVDFNKRILNAKQDLEKSRIEEEKRLQEIEKNISAYAYYNSNTENNTNMLTYANINKILSINFIDLINYFETIEKEYKEGRYKYIKTENSKYNIVNNEVIHDFKNNKTYNKISYLYEKLNVNNILQLARALEKLTGESYLEVNENLANEAINKALNKAKTLQEFNELVKNELNVEFCRVDLKSKEIQIADIKMSIDTDKILEKINQNKKQKVKQRSYGSLKNF